MIKSTIYVICAKNLPDQPTTRQPRRGGSTQDLESIQCDACPQTQGPSQHLDLGTEHGTRKGCNRYWRSQIVVVVVHNFVADKLDRQSSFWTELPTWRGRKNTHHRDDKHRNTSTLWVKTGQRLLKAKAQRGLLNWWTLTRLQTKCCERPKWKLY